MGICLLKYILIYLVLGIVGVKSGVKFFFWASDVYKNIRIYGQPLLTVVISTKHVSNIAGEWEGNQTLYLMLYFLLFAYTFYIPYKSLQHLIYLGSERNVLVNILVNQKFIPSKKVLAPPFFWRKKLLAPPFFYEKNSLHLLLFYKKNSWSLLFFHKKTYIILSCFFMYCYFFWAVYLAVYFS